MAKKRITSTETSARLMRATRGRTMEEACHRRIFEKRGAREQD
eukprot:CAMPEP_0184503698 /NCGR_PEP_ID=MMETSP0113_2-20130426/52046_1 /TAXON_ID=91329 /ORGANISM="Norrisiella sphaerica, Strain BC52" /LENGTH=42 /DNA_ID= /DNA_START= /DNA_END= /DNA_ORIENTATION=